MKKTITHQNFSKIAMKNSAYSLSFGLINKFGGLILTIFLARILLPELFGLYSLVLSIVLIAVTLTDVGINLTGIRYMSKELTSNNRKKARSYFRYLLKIKTLLIIFFITIILLISKPLSQIVFNKPLVFLPLVFSCFYIFVESLRSFFTIPFITIKKLKPLLPVELTFQSTKIILSLLAIFFLSYNSKVPGLFVAFAIAGIVFLFMELFFLIKEDKDLIFGEISKIDKKKILRYMGYMGITGITLIVFGSIDTLMLGRFVDISYLGYYRAALGLIVSVSALLPFSGVLLPLFTQIHGKRLDRGLTKSLRYLLIISIPMFIGIMFISKHIIYFLYGNDYLAASLVLFVLSPLVLISPLISLYSTLFQAKAKPNVLAKFVVISLLINIVLNYIFIKLFLNISQQYALLGAGIATILSNVFLLAVLILKTKTLFKLKSKERILFKAILSTIVMAIFLFFYNRYININIWTGAIEVLLGIVIYFVVLFFIRGFSKKDLELARSVLKKSRE